MNDIDDRLTDLLARSAGSVDVHPDVDAVLTGEHRGGPVVGLGRRPRDTRRLLALAAALLVVVGLVGVGVVASRPDTEPVGVAQAPPPDRFPVFGHLPAELEGEHVEANDGEGIWHTGLASTFRPEATVAHAAIGRVDADGRITDITQMAAADQGLEDSVGPPPDAEVEDVGDGYLLMALAQEVWLYGPDRSLTAVGTSGTEALVRDLIDDLKATADPVAVLRAVEPPAGIALLAPPTRREPAQAEALVPVAPPCDAPSRSLCETTGPTIAVETGVGPPQMAVVSVGGAVTPVDVGGADGLMSSASGLTRIAWTTADGVTVSIVAEYDAEEALAVARGVELVDEDTWRTTYPEWEEDDVQTPTTPTTPSTTTAPEGGTTEAAPGAHPLVGQPVPPVPGTTSEQVDGRALVLGFTGAGPDCAGCARLSGAVVLGDPAIWDPIPTFWASDDGPDPSQVVLALADDDLLVSHEVDAPALAAWSITELPTTVVAGPDGIVTAVFVGGTTVEDLVAAVHAVG